MRIRGSGKNSSGARIFTSRPPLTHRASLQRRLPKNFDGAHGSPLDLHLQPSHADLLPDPSLVTHNVLSRLSLNFFGSCPQT
mmetsp:Transcript_38244/g.101510  ORF Transcript_38244/g.101510 Transcript_38244/m.101510 type:complete len:82 (+) Transcript_38244:104-349(+)